MKYFTLTLLLLLAACSSEESAPKEAIPQAPATQTTVDPKAFIGKDYLIDDQHSYIGFKIKYFGNSPVRGRFDEFDGTMFYDKNDIESLSVSMFIDVNSINTGNERRDNDLVSEGTWFDAFNHMIITFLSKRVMKKTDGSFDLIGDLTIKGITKEVVVPFSPPTAITRDWAGNEQVDFSGKLTLNRQDFGVYGGDFWSSVMENGLTQLSDEVEIEMDIHTRRADYQARYEAADSADINKMVLDQIKANGLKAGLKAIDSLRVAEKLTSGKLSSIGYTLNAWKMHEAALEVFKLRALYFPERVTTWNQKGITHLLLGDLAEAEESFKTLLAIDSIDSRASEYLRLMEKIK